MTDARDDGLADALLTWYAARRRDLPWRRDVRPYTVLLSELMLQQTRVETVVPYFDRFVRRWPTIEDLAAAEDDAVMQEWAGLGYYSRARNLLRAARAAVERGGLPSDPKELRELPGVGPYTAGAVASIAFGVRAPLVDGNVERVLCRLDARRGDPRAKANLQAIWARADALVPASDPGGFNQALMELGATVCTPRNPSCIACPLRERCEGHRLGIAESLPEKAKKAPPTPVAGVYGLLLDDRQVLVGRRPAGGLLGDLWEPVGAEIPADADPEAAVRAAFRERAGLEVRVAGAIGEVVHVFTHRRLRATVFEVRCPSPRRAMLGAFYADLRFVSLDDPGVALSTLARKVLALAPPEHALPLAADGVIPYVSR